MSDTENQQSGTQGQETGDNQMTGLSELDLLKSRAKMMGITFSNNIGLDALKAKVEAKMAGEPDVQEDSLDEQELPQEARDAIEPNALELGARANLAGAAEAEVEQRPETLREKLYRENMALLRCRITNLDPKKKDLPGEIITVANEFLGTVKVFVPFGETTEEGWHIPTIIYNTIKTRKFLNIRTVRDPRTRTEKVSTTWAPEFAIEVLDPLTPQELKSLGQAQIAAGSLDMQTA